MTPTRFSAGDTGGAVCGGAVFRLRGGHGGECWMLDFSDEQAYLAWLEEVGEKSAFSSKVSPRAEDRVVTLSTCSYEFENARFVLHGVLRPEEE